MRENKSLLARHAAAPLSSPDELYEAERVARPSAFCVTGASGYLGAHVVKRLLKAGHTVHAITRDPDDPERTAHLQSLPGAAEKLYLFKGDILELQTLHEPTAGCEYIIHCAGPMKTQLCKAQVQDQLIIPHQKGTENVLQAATSARVRKVVYTAGVMSATSNNQEFGEDHIMTEKDWSVKASEDYMPLNYAKRLAEQKAWDMYRKQQSMDHSWELATVLPGFLMGPPIGPSPSPSIQFCVDMLHGKFARTFPPLGFLCVDVRDAAAAHVLAAVLPQAKGRYLCVERSCNIMDMMKEVQPHFKQKLVGTPTPKWLLKGVSKFTSLISWDQVDAQHGTVLRFDNSKIVAELGLKFHSASDALHAMGKQLQELGRMPK